MDTRRSPRLFLVAALAVALLAGCSPGRPRQSTADEHYTSAVVEGQTEKINLDAVHEAFFSTAGKDFREWMRNFEGRVNEIHQEEGVVSIDADKKGGLVRVTGFIDKNDEPGYQAGADETLFELRQTGEASGERGFPYQLYGSSATPHHDGYPPPHYAAHHHGLLDNPFVQLFVLSQIMRPGFSYYTPPARYTVLRQYRQGYRQTPRYRTQMAQNKGFFGKLFAKRQSDMVRSSKGFGGSFGNMGERRRSWYGSSGGNDSRWSGRRSSGFGSGGGSSWSGRRSSGFGFGGGSSWGGRRSSGLGGRSWGGRRR